ncbi:hypothetical protein Godav_015664 [Gossypium davidsonii]|uniref:Uncharacterized protein n=1 Tax=Gossypium davidsonii TaxID=34287 RepID=A0A7J8RPR9_GOSDV|nr:hypothetical protein [Gossypium davidsonii]
MLKLLNEGFQVSIINNLHNSVTCVVLWVELGAKLSQKLGNNLVDERTRDDLEKLFSKMKFDTVIHFPSIQAIVESYFNPVGFLNNLMPHIQVAHTNGILSGVAAINLAKRLEKAGKLVVMISSFDERCVIATTLEEYMEHEKRWQQQLMRQEQAIM